MTAAKIFGVSEAEVIKEQRQQAKAVNFGLIYGMSPNRLVKEGIARDQKQGAAIIKAFFELYPRIKRMHKYLEQDGAGNSKGSNPTANPDSGNQSQTLAKSEGCQFQRWYTTTEHALQSTLASSSSWQNERRPSGSEEASGGTRCRTSSRDLWWSDRADPPPLADEVQIIVEQAMIDGMQIFFGEVPITAEAVVGKSWAEKWILTNSLNPFLVKVSNI